MRNLFLIFLGFALLLPASFAGSPSFPSFNYTDYKDMIRGFLLGIGVRENYLDHLLGCLSESKRQEAEFVDLMNKIDVLDFKNMPLTTDLFVQLYQVIVISIVEIDICAKDEPEYDRLFKKIYHMMAQTIYKRLMLNFVTNSQQLFKDIQDACDNYLRKSYLRMGKDLGEIMDLILIHVIATKARLESDPFAEFFKGLRQSLSRNGQPEALACLETLDSPYATKVAMKMNLEFMRIEKVDIDHIQEMLEALLGIVDVLDEAVLSKTNCGTILRLFGSAAVTGGKAWREELLTDINKNPIPVFEAVLRAKAAYQSGNQKEYGMALGELLSIALGQ